MIKVTREVPLEDIIIWGEFISSLNAKERKMETKQAAEKKAVCPRCKGTKLIETLCPAPIHLRPHDPRECPECGGQPVYMDCPDCCGN